MEATKILIRPPKQIWVVKNSLSNHLYRKRVKDLVQNNKSQQQCCASSFRKSDTKVFNRQHLFCRDCTMPRKYIIDWLFFLISSSFQFRLWITHILILSTSITQRVVFLIPSNRWSRPQRSFNEMPTWELVPHHLSAENILEFPCYFHPHFFQIYSAYSYHWLFASLQPGKVLSCFSVRNFKNRSARLDECVDQSEY